MNKIFLAIATVLTLASCVSTKTLYSWYDYEDTVYEYNKEPTDKNKEAMMKTLLKMSERQKGTRGSVPPGFYAEYGYTIYKSGKKEEGIKLLKEEIRLYPESKTYIERIINQLEK
ncbi:MAG: DUF4810 domain-containing protein [Prevotellaceae bacterium]|nr:DUF4810 domain-containing protein [Prevotellaceae bacterium]